MDHTAPPPYNPSAVTECPTTAAPYPAPSSPYSAAPYPVPSQTQASYPLNNGPQAMPQPAMQPQGSYPLNSGPQTIMYSSQNVPPGQYTYNPLVQHQGIPIAAINSTPRPYQSGAFSRPSRFGGNRKMTYISLALCVAFTIVALTVFLIIFFKAKHDIEEIQQRHDDTFDSIKRKNEEWFENNRNW